MTQKPSIPKGTRDFTPSEMARRNYIFETIKKSFRLFGFEQIETPAMENLSTLLGKYGEEGDRLLFKILNSGDFLKDVKPEDYDSKNLPRLASDLCEKGLRYDLTVPFARFVVQNRNDLQFPFKRFQIQPVWRADRPQKGRYREFYQCDADIIGSDSLWNEVDLISMIDEVFSAFGVKVTVKLNNRKILSGIAELVGAPEKLVDITVAIDKIDKIGIEKVEEELRQKEVSEEAIKKIRPLLELKGSNEEKLLILKGLLKDIQIGIQGVEELEKVVGRVDSLGHKCGIEVDVSLARGLNYYTGIILEVKADDVEIGSIAGGGRYDNLTGIFGLPGTSGVGISFGADRIYDVLNQLNLYPKKLGEAVKVLFVNFDEKGATESVRIIKKLRENGIASELYPDESKMKKQMAYANALDIPFVALIGEDEIKTSTVQLKEMTTGQQEKLTEEELILKLKD